MNRPGFTLVEILGATVLTASLAITASGWLLQVQRSATQVRDRAEQLRSAWAVALALQNDLAHTVAGAPLDLTQLTMAVVGSATTSRREVTWAIHDGVAQRSDRDPAGGPWTRNAVANGITMLRAVRDDRGRLTLSVATHDEHIELLVDSVGPDVP